jgi:uncharacterized protein (UPF0212 family)
VITHRCKTCNGPVDVALVDTTSQLEFARNNSRTYVWGMWEACPTCGSVDQPTLVVDDTALLTPRVSQTQLIDLSGFLHDQINQDEMKE